MYTRGHVFSTAKEKENRLGAEGRRDREEERRRDVTNERGLREEGALYASDPVTLPVVPLDLRAALWGFV